MEKYEPSPVKQSPKRDRPHFNEIHQDYAYAYYEPGMPMRHQNIPGYYEEASSSKPVPANSMRALMSTTRKNLPRNGIKYGYAGNGSVIRQHENVYEEIRDEEKARKLKSSSIISLNHVMVEEEFRRVQNRHHRILGELNLSVEEMLMPNCAPAENPPLSTSLNENNLELMRNHLEYVKNPINQVNATIQMDDELNGHMDLDSGFSGSNSSYIGGMRYHKTIKSSLAGRVPISTKSKINCKFINEPANYSNQILNDEISGMGEMSELSEMNEMGMTSISSRSSSSLYDSGKKSMINLSTSIPSNTGNDVKGVKGNFWNRKAWRKIPGFSSTTSINKLPFNGEFSLFYLFLLIKYWRVTNYCHKYRFCNKLRNSFFGA